MSNKYHKYAGMAFSFANSKLYTVLVKKNQLIEEEYNNYLAINRRGKKSNRVKEWIFLIRLNLAYFILNRRYNPTEDMDAQLFSEFDPGCMLPHEYAEELLQYDIISFDIFDTLLFRLYQSPKMVFKFLERENQIADFARERIRAEEEIRRITQQKYRTTEVSLKDIYQYMEEKLGLAAEEGMKKEIEMERELCYANPYMQTVFNLLIANKKRVIIISDMYLEEAVLNSILQENHYAGYEKIYVSCEYKTSKNDGGLYNIVENELGGEYSYVHIGDNKHSDIEMARQAGWDAKYFYNCPVGHNC